MCQMLEALPGPGTEQCAAKLAMSINSDRQTGFHSNCMTSDMLEWCNSDETVHGWETWSCCSDVGMSGNRCHGNKMLFQDGKEAIACQDFSPQDGE